MLLLLLQCCIDIMHKNDCEIYAYLMQCKNGKINMEKNSYIIS